MVFGQRWPPQSSSQTSWQIGKAAISYLQAAARERSGLRPEPGIQLDRNARDLGADVLVDDEPRHLGGRCDLLVQVDADRVGSDVCHRGRHVHPAAVLLERRQHVAFGADRDAGNLADALAGRDGEDTRSAEAGVSLDPEGPIAVPLPGLDAVDPADNAERLGGGVLAVYANSVTAGRGAVDTVVVPCEAPDAVTSARR